MQLPANFFEKNPLVAIDLTDFEPGHLAPGLGGIIAILEVLRRQNERSKEHPSSAHQCAICRTIRGLLHCEVKFRDRRLDQDQIIQRHLERRV